MTANLRHLDYGPDACVPDVGAAGLQAILDSRDVTAWRPILRHVRDDPWGPVARRVEQVVEHLESYGTAAALRAWVARCRAGLPADARTLAEQRDAEGRSQRQVAAAMGISQAQVARLEAATNPTLRSLGRYLAALGMRPLALVALDEDGSPRTIRWPATAAARIRKR
ncbi:MAG: helix-turn-helix domain-containing protein [Euzebyaceae bacterium]|nr:helix-turn-helix domain-containing protein [Euzebyaceae bacterium]